MKKMSSIGGVVSALLMLSLSANDGYCVSKVSGSTSRSQASKNNLNKPTSGNQIVGNAVQKALQSQPIQQLLQVGQDQLAQQTDKLTDKLTKSISQKFSNSAVPQQQKAELDADYDIDAVREELKARQMELDRMKQLAEENAAQTSAIFKRAARQQLSNSARLQEEEKALKLQKAKTIALFDQRIKTLRDQLNQEILKKRVATQNIDKRISATRDMLRAELKKEKINNKAGQILSGLKNKFSNLQNKLNRGRKS